MFKKAIAVGKITLVGLVMTGLLAGCGTMVDLELDTPVRDDEVVESQVSKDDATKESKVTEATTETTTETGDFIIVKDDTPGVNAGHMVAVPKDYEQKYIKYEDMEPVTMYGISSMEMYADFNATEGAFMIQGYVYEGDDFNIDGKGTFDGVEYYRVVRSENSMNPYHLIIPASALSFEKPVDNANTNSNPNPALNEKGGFTLGSN